MKEKTKKPKAVVQEHVTILKTKGYRGFRISNEKEIIENAIEVGAKSKNDIMFIGTGSSLEEAYENLIERIDITLDGE